MEGAVSTVDLSGLITSLTSSISPAEVISVLSSVVGIGMAFFLMWFGIRKAIKVFTTALQSGKIKI